jgi:hypothetical protein
MLESGFNDRRAKDTMQKFRVTGSNKETSARMTLELTAASKGDAERKAAHVGMIVSHVAPIVDVPNTVEEHRHAMAKNYRQEESGGKQKMLLIAFGVLLVVFVIMQLLGYGF